MNYLSNNSEFKKAHQYCANNKEQLNESSICGCFYCCKIYSPNDIKEYLNEKSGTAICPYCVINSVIAEKSGFKITKEFLYL